MSTTASSLEIAFRLPIGGFPRAVFQSDYAYTGGRLRLGERTLLEADSREALEAGVEGSLDGAPIAMRLDVDGERKALRLMLEGKRVQREARIFAAPSRSAWIHAFIALGASFAGFSASFFYLMKSKAQDDPWALKMGQHMAGWHLLLTLTLFPLSVWGQRLGIRSVQLASLIFFGIHVSIAMANSDFSEPFITIFNTISGVLFFVSVIYGQRAHRDMAPAAAFASGRV
jgi:hypothetical protein